MQKISHGNECYLDDMEVLEKRAKELGIKGFKSDPKSKNGTSYSDVLSRMTPKLIKEFIKKYLL